MYQVLLVAWMYMTPIIYPTNIIPEAYRFWMLNFNPMYYLVEIVRTPLYGGVLPDWQTFGVAAALAFGTLVVGWLYFSHKADGFTYQI
jgi:ABC-2 type transport system permease protein